MYANTCRLCGSPFQSTMPHANVCKECKNRPCIICGKPFKREWPFDQLACSKECRKILYNDPKRNAIKTEKRKANLMEKYGVDNVAKLPEVRQKIVDSRQTIEFKEKVKRTSQERYGVDHYQSSPEVKERARQGYLKKYGVDNVAKLDSVRKMISEKLKSPEIRAQYAETSMKHFGVPHPHMDPEIKAKTEQTMIEHFGVPYYVMLPEYRSAQATHQVSLINQAIAEAIQEKCNLQTSYEFRIDRKFYDIKIENSNILIEVDPSYTHSNLPNHWDKNGMSPNYHLEKTETAEANGFRCIHVFDWDNLDRLTNMLNKTEKIYARNCKLEDSIKPEQIKQFINENHLQGDARGAKHCYGLVYNGELISAMTFGKPRYNHNYEWELLRLCTKKGYTVIGGASRMFKKFIDEVHPNSIISYCDRAKFTGTVYQKIGMTLHHISPPAKIWSKDTEYITDNLLRQRGYDQIFKTNFGKGTSNEELMIENGWRSVYDCGQYVFEWKA